MGWAKTVNASLTQIVSTRADGSDPRVVKAFSGAHVPTAPLWSPDGRQIAFSSAAEGNNSEGYFIYVMDADGSNERLVAAGVRGALAWRPDSVHLAYCPIGFGNTDLAGFSGINVRSGTVRVVDTRDGRVVYSRGSTPGAPVLTGPPTTPNGHYFQPVWEGPDALLVNFQNDQLTAVESVPPQVPPVYTTVVPKNQPEVHAFNIRLPAVGDTSPVSRVQLPSRAVVLARSPTSGALLLWQDNAETPERLLWAEGSTVFTLAEYPVLQFDRLASFTPDGSRCTFDGRLFDALTLRNQGLAGAPVLSTVPGVALSWFYG